MAAVMLTAMLHSQNSYHIVDELTDAAVDLAAESGAALLSVRAIAQRMRITPQALLNRWENKDRVIKIVVSTVADRWIQHREGQWFFTRKWHQQSSLAGLLSLLPAEQADVDELSTWLSFVDLARTRADYADIVREVRDRERGMVETSLRELADREPEVVEVEIVIAALDGIRRRLTDLDDPYPLADARAILSSTIFLTTRADRAA